MGNFYEVNSEALRLMTEKFVHHFQQVRKAEGTDGLVEYAYSLTDQIQEAAELNKITTCSKNECSFCCHSTINVSQGEFDYIKKRIKQEKIKPDRHRSKIQNAAKMSAENEKDIKWADRACPFLSSTDGKGKCTIYAIRPLLCRNHNSVEPDPNRCNKADDYKRNIQEGRIVELEAIVIALMHVTQKTEPIIPIHKII